MQAMRNAYKIIIWGCDGKRSLWKSGHRGGIILKKVLKMGFEDVAWIQVPQDRVKWQAVTTMIMNLWSL
jgi:hypothetical protein